MEELEKRLENSQQSNKTINEIPKSVEQQIIPIKLSKSIDINELRKRVSVNVKNGKDQKDYENCGARFGGSGS